MWRARTRSAPRKARNEALPLRAIDPRLLRYARSTSIALAAAVGLGTATAGLAVVQAWLLAVAISAAFVRGSSVEVLWPTLIPLAAVFAARAAIAWGQEVTARLSSARVKSELRMQLLAAAATPGPGRELPPSGEVVALATRGLDALDAYFARYLPQLVLACIVPVVVVVCLFASDQLAGITVLLTLPLIPLFMALIGSMTVRRRKRRWNALARLSSHFLDVAAGLPTLRIFGRGPAQVERLAAVTDEYRRESMGTLRIAFLSAFALELAATLSIALVAVGVGLELVDGLLSLQTGLFVLVLAPEAYLPLRQLGASFHASEEGLTAAASALAVIDEAARSRGSAPAGGAAERAGRKRRAPERGGDLVPPPLPLRAVRIDSVSVRHGGRDLVAPFEASLVVRSGEVTGLAGPSGSGKSTLVEVLLGLRRPDSGYVELAGADGRAILLDSVDRAAWHARVSWVPQHPYCFPGTVADNLRLASPDATDEEVAAALERAGLAELDPRTRLGEGGTGISSGQGRRVGVARALLRGGDLMIFDEPTAGLDVEAEATVLAAIRSAAHEQGRAVLLLAHRPAALRVADTVATIESRIDEIAVPDAVEPPGVAGRGVDMTAGEAMEAPV
jgi:ATP-binding cassette subfamily C protein CydCD